MTMNIALIAAMATNRVIGRNNNLPWHLPNDLKYFKQATMGKPIMMGRKTFESIGRPLPGRTNIVITRDQSYSAEGIRIVHSIDEALALAESIALLDGAKELMVIGGEQLYQAILPRAQRLYLTHVYAEVKGDAWFPVVDFDQWQELGREDFSADGPNPYDYSFVVYNRNE